MEPSDLAASVRSSDSGAPLNMLAISGGGAGCAFGAGVLVGMSASGTRPLFDVVTGVSAGALLAPFAFLGSDWDYALTRAAGEWKSTHMLRPRGLGAVFGSSLFRGEPLRALVNEYITTSVVAAIAREAANGRLLLIATTDLNTEETVIWDLTAIALSRSPSAVKTIQDVLVASASVPGVFPPVMIQIRDKGISRNEMHVDGGLTIPFVIFPSGYERDQTTSHKANIYVLMDGQVSTPPHDTSSTTGAILSRSLSTGLKQMLLTHLELAGLTSQMNGSNLKIAALPPQYPFRGDLNFEEPALQAMYTFGFGCAKTTQIWTSINRVESEPASGSCR